MIAVNISAMVLEHLFVSEGEVANFASERSHLIVFNPDVSGEVLLEAESALAEPALILALFLVDS